MSISVLSALMLLIQAPGVSEAAEGEGPEVYSFAERQEQLVEMARLLGQAHHLHQSCQPYDYLPDRFRDRMKELVALEEPMAETKSRMVSAFNEGFQSARAAYEYCDQEAETRMQKVGEEGAVLTARLARPFRADGQEDYYAVQPIPSE